MWDTAGQERFRSMTSAFFGKAQGALVVFDVSDRDSFDNLNGWIEEIERVRDIGYIRNDFSWRNGVSLCYSVQAAPTGCAIIICANKVDLPAEKWAVSRESFNEYAESSGYTVIETSASSGRNTNEVIRTKWKACC